MSTAKAYDLGLKGCTTFRPNEVTGSVLSTASVTEDRDVTVMERDPALEWHHLQTEVARDRPRHLHHHE